MRPFHFLIILWLLAACTDSRETRLQRFLLQSNAMAGDHQEDKAEYYLREALKIDSCFADALNNLGTLYFNQRKYPEALEYYDRALGCSPDFLPAAFNRANTAYEIKEYYKALADIARIARQKPDTAVVWFMAGLNHTRLRQFDDALTSFDKARTIDSANVELMVNIGTVYYYKKEFTRAREFLNAASRQDPGEANTYNALAMIEIEEGKYDNAKRLIDKSLSIRKDDPFFLNNSGYVKLLVNDLEGGREEIDRSIMEDPDNAWAYRNKGIYYLMKGQYKDAIRLLSQAIRLDPFTEKINFYLGEAYEKEGQQGEACKYYQEAFNLKEIAGEEYFRKCRIK